jgi:hypothetical protein
VTLVEKICPRSRGVWEVIGRLVEQAFHINYITYNNIVIGGKPTIDIIENLIIIGLKQILVKDRSLQIPREQIINKIKVEYFIEKEAMRKKAKRSRE